MATINLGAIKFNWRGAYNNATAYVVDDVVSSGGNSYVCILASTGNAVTNGTYWELMAQSGTDLTTTLTTQGDILYRDGSGLQKLGAGTSGQVLQTGGTGANPSWVDASGGAIEKLSTVSFSSVAQVTVNGLSTYFGSTPSDYLHYRIVCEFTSLTGSATTYLYMRMMGNNSALTGAKYHYSNFKTESNTINTSVAHAENTTQWQLNVDGIRETNDYSHYMILDVFNLNDNSSDYKYLQYSGRHSWVQHDSATRVHVNQIGGAYNSDTGDNIIKTGLQFYPDQGVFSGKINIYGVKA